MTSTLLIALGLLATAVIICCVYLLQKKNTLLARLQERLSASSLASEDLSQSLAQTRNDLQSQQQTNQQLQTSITQLQANLDHEKSLSQEKLKLLNDSRQQMTVEFKNIANEILEDKSQKFTDSNKRNMAAILTPLQERIQLFEKKVEETYDKESKERFSLAKEVQNLQELNKQISEDAINLTNALKGDNKAQGNWGEVILESLLEKSGLVKDREYQIQQSLKAEDGSRYQPDVVVHMPESKDIIIDSKVSLKAWDAYCSLDQSEANASAKAEHLKLHTQSIRSHVKSLSSKDYQNLIGVNSLDYVFMFMPIEAAYFEAMKADSDIFQFAFERNIIIVVPTTLLTTLKTVQNLWRLSQQNQNAQVIATQAGRLYDKFVAFVADLDEIGTKIDASKKSFDKAQNKLSSGRGNLITRVEKLKLLGAKTSKKHRDELVADGLELGLEGEGQDEVLTAPLSSEDDVDD
ncbi:MAG: DNA recombination protein RmuC [SAR86 cluster bacterium]|uniref:DNA recombination protein RmuC n=1 Tax=SAR86 cluster bacterium TaxID=2030880 RepID=A0A2A4MM18_9GAMM|nr:MAG: DNA recombination protein RmuC [SAR86 cluster bacterium]